MSRRRAYHSHGYRTREAYKLHCQQTHHMILRLQLRIEDPHMSRQPIQCEMHLCVSLPIHLCTTLWLKLILSKITGKPSGVLKRVDKVKRSRGRPKLTWEESVKRDLKDWDISEELALDRSAWRLAINVPEP